MENGQNLSRNEGRLVSRLEINQVQFIYTRNISDRNFILKNSHIRNKLSSN